MLHRRSFLHGLFSAFAAPAIVRAQSLMPVKAMPDLPPLVHAITPDGEVLFRGYHELLAVTRKAFVPRLVVQLYTATPLLSAMRLLEQTYSEAGEVFSIAQD